MRRRWTVLGLVGLGMVVGLAVAGDDNDDEKIALDQVPAAAREALLKLAGDAKITEVEREKEDGLVLYEAEWSVNGKEAEASVTANGDLVEQEEEIDLGALPPRGKSVVAKKFPAGAKLECERVLMVVYEIEAKINGKEKEILVLPSGKILGHDDGDDGDEEDEEEISRAEAPAAVQATILAQAKGAKIKEVERETEDGRTVYEAEWEENGQEIEITVAPDGTLLEREIEDDGDG